MTERVTLILENQFEVSRQDLISKSDYFASLFSSNFGDSQCSEYRINPDIDINTLQTFVAWVSDHKTSTADNGHRIKPSLAKYVSDLANFDVLMKLLRLSVLFVVDTLIKDLTELIACHWLIPQKSVQIWLVAKELDLATLRDLAKATCIDRLEYVPESALLDLSEEDFVEIVGNIRVEIYSTFPSRLIKRWVKRNVAPGESNALKSRYPFTLIEGHRSVDKMYDDQYEKNNIQCIVGHKRTPDNKVTKCVYGWDGTTFSEILDLSSCPICVNDVVGLQVVGRAFDIYLVGGKYEKGSRGFQKEIWRYSMIVKTWFYVTRMPHPRRHMAVAFVDTKMLLAGGVGEYQTRLRSIDVYDIETGKWMKGRKTPVFYNNKSLMSSSTYSHMTFYNINGKNIHTYSVADAVSGDKWWNGEDSSDDENLSEDDDDDTDSDDDVDPTKRRGIYYYIGEEPYDRRCVYPRFLTTQNGNQYILGLVEKSHTLRIIEVDDFVCISASEPGRLVGKCRLKSFDNQVGNGPYLVGFALESNSTLCIEVFSLDKGKSKILKREIRTDIADLCPNDPIGCFNIWDPKSLNKVFVSQKRR